MLPHDPAIHSPAGYVRIEASALAALAVRMETSMRPALDATLTLLSDAAQAGRPLVLTGIGKSGIIARKLAATFRSTGTPAHFLHPAEAAHGDLGLLGRASPILALSYSGETEELLTLLPAFARLGCPLVVLTGSPGSALAAAATCVLDTGIDTEACPLNLAPTASTTVMLALGDALALELSHRAGFAPNDFADLHPGGRLGHGLSRVRTLMHSGEALPAVSPSTPLPEVIHEMSRKKLGMTTVLTEHRRLAGIVVDGDLRRLLERVGPEALRRTAGEIMNATPQTIAPHAFASEALARMEACRITALVVVGKPVEESVQDPVQKSGAVEQAEVLGVVHLHDLWDSPPARGAC